MLNIINFTHGAQYMMGAFCAYFLLNYAGVGYGWSLLLAPIIVGSFGVVIERTMLARLYKLDHLYGLLLTFGLALIIQGIFRNQFGSSGLPYQMPELLTGGHQPGLHVPAEVSRLGDHCLAWSCVWPPGTSSSEPSSARICAQRPRIRHWCRLSASTCRA